MCNRFFHIIALAAIFLAGHVSARATTKTVTYTITDVEKNLTSYNIVFTRSGDPFETSAPTTYTTSVTLSAIGNLNFTGGSFSIDLADGFKLEVSWPGSSNVGFDNNCILPQASGKEITYRVSCTDDNYYVMHVTMQGTGDPWLDTGYDNLLHFAQDYATAQHFGTLTVTYADAPWGGSGTQADPYVITRADQLDYLASRVNATYDSDNFSGKYFVLANDIAYTHTTDWNDFTPSDSAAENNFTPIGRYGQSFQGHFNGQGHTISGIRVWKGYALTDNSNESLGLFGFVSGGSVCNVVLRDANIRGLKNMGGIVGYLSGGSVTGCTLYQVLVGSHYDKAPGIGIVVGYNNDGTVTDCYYRDCIKGRSYKKPDEVTIMPHPERWDNVFTVTTADNTTAAYQSGASVTIDDVTYYAEGSTFTLGYNGTVPAGYSVVYTATNGGTVSGSTLTMPASDTEVTANFTVIDYETGHAGTEADPYIIYNYEQLQMLASRVNTGNNYSYNKHFKLGGDITFPDGANNHTPIGNTDVSNKKFKGTFDGNGFTISGIRINSSDNGMGLFGHVYQGTVKNVILANSDITGNHDVGGIVGFNNGTVTDCRVLSDVYINTDADYPLRHGGIAGQNNYGTVNGCYSAATVTSNGKSICTNFGGIVGYNNSGTVSNSIAVGADVSGYNGYRGAIVGTNDHGTLAGNYYYACTVGGTANATNAGTGSGDVSENDGAVETVESASKPAIIGDPVATYSSGFTIYNHGAYWNGKYYVRHDLAAHAEDYTLTQGTKDGVSAYWGTFYNGTNNYELAGGASAYTMGTDHKLYRLGDNGRVIPAGTAVVIIGTSSSITIIDTGTGSVTAADHATGGNQLYGSDSAVTLDGSGKVPVPGSDPATTGTPYVLSASGTPAAIAFRRFTGASIPAGKAYYVVVTP